MSLAIVMPWRPTEDRKAAYELTRAWYRDTLPAVPIYEVDTNDTPFNLGACRNKGVRKAAEQGATVVVVTDADTIPAPDLLHAAILGATADGKLHYPFDKCIYSGYSAEPGAANGGVFAITVASWDLIGGQDQRINAWGADDDQLVASATCFLGRPVRHRGVAVSMWHPAFRVCSQANRDVLDRYYEAIDDPERMREVIAGR